MSRSRLALGVVLLLLLAAAGCSGKDSHSATSVPRTTVEETLPPAPSTTPTTFTTVPGRPRTTTTEPTDMLGGGARINGKVLGPSGEVAGATVRVERLVNDQVATRDINAFNGGFDLAGIRGGAYRVRAWKQPDLFLMQPMTFFLAADETKSFDLRVSKVADVNLQTTLNPEKPPAQDPYSVTILVFAGTVSSSGDLQAIPRPQEPVQLVVTSGLAIVGIDRGQTDSNGRVRFQVRCLSGGPVQAALLVSTLRLDLGLPNCPAVPG